MVVVKAGGHGRTEIHGVVRLYADPDNERAQYAIIVGRELTGLGLGRHMMERILDYARGRGSREVFGDVLRKNAPMLGLCKDLGLGESPRPEGPSAVRVALWLVTSAPPAGTLAAPRPS